MPNWCENYCLIKHQDKNKLRELKSHCGDENTDIFSFIKPEPDYAITPVSRWSLTNIEDKTPAITQDSWWHWRANNWGTKWEPQIHLAEMISEESGREVLSLSFDTAWSPPEGIYGELVEKEFDVKAFYIESSMGFAGVWDNGQDSCYSVFSLGDAKEIFPPESYFYNAED
jgi:hypothetical protein